jgi:hypothetical protein
MNILLDLPEDFARLVLVKWTRVKDIARLDSAVANHTLREPFCALAHNPLTIYTDAVKQDDLNANIRSVLKWAVTRSARLDGIIIDGRLCQYPCDARSLLSAFLSMSGPAISWLNLGAHWSRADDFIQHAMLEVAKRCPNLQHVNVRVAETESGALLWDEPLITLTQSCRKLTDLSLFQVEISKQGLTTALKHCNCLQRLSVRTGNEVISTEIAIPTLKSIKWSSPYMTDAVLIAIGERCAELEALTMFWSPLLNGEHVVTDVGVRAVLQGCPLLRETDVEQAKGISGELRVELARRRHMTALRAAEWWGMDDELAQAVLRASPNLTALSCLWRSDWLTDATLAVCAEHCLLVTAITARRCPLITDGGVRATVSNFASKLLYLHLEECTQLSDDSLLAVAEQCPLLKGIVWIGDASGAVVMKLAESCHELIYVYLQHIQVNDAGLRALATHCPKLKEIVMKRCPDVTMQGVCHIVAGCPVLKTIGLPFHLRREVLPELGGKWKRLEDDVYVKLCCAKVKSNASRLDS